MKRDDLERYLERGNQLGFIKPTDCDDFLGWILLDKERPNNRFEALLEPGEDNLFVENQNRVRRQPYVVSVLELRRNVHESDRYENNDDYRLRLSYRFSTLDEVEELVEQYGFTLENIKWRVDLDAP